MRHCFSRCMALISFITCILCTLMSWPASASASASEQDDQQQPYLQQQDLYLDAMRALSEGRANDASDTLTRMLEQEPQHAGAWLDLAIIQCQLGYTKEAERLFQAIESRFAPPPGIMEVIHSHRAKGCKKPSSDSFSLMLGRGNDSNVNQGASNPNFSTGSGSSRIDLVLLPAYLPQQDQYTLLSSNYARNLNVAGDVGYVQFRARQNDSLTQYDTTSLLLGLEHPWRWGSWSGRTGGSMSLLTLGSQLYQKQVQWQTRLFPSLSSLPSDKMQFSVLGSLAHSAYSRLSNFDSNTLELSGQLAYQGGKSHTVANLGVLYDRGEAGRPGGNRQGWFASLQNQLKINDTLRAEFGWTQQNWLSQSAYSPGLIDQIRHQNSQLLRAALVIPLQAQHSLQIEWKEVRNHENISILQYNSRLLQVSWQWQGF